MAASPQIRLAIDAASVIEVLARHPLPLSMNQIAVVENGGLEIKSHEPLRFRFAFGGALIEAVCMPSADRMVVNLGAELGPLPYSVQSVGARRGIVAMLGRPSNTNGGFELGAENMIQFRGSLTIGRPFTPVALVTDITAYMLEMMPQFDRLAAILTPAISGQEAGVQ